MALLRSQLKLLLQRLQRSRLGYAVGHIKVRCHATSSGSTAFAIDIGLLRQTRFTEMHVIINDTWQNVTTRSIDRFIERCYGLLLGNLCNDAVFYDYIAILRTAFIDNMSTLYQYSHGLGMFSNGVAGAFEAIVSIGASAVSLSPFMRCSFS